MLVTNNLSTSTPKLEGFFKEYTHVFYIDYFYKFVLDKKKSPTFLEFLAFLLSVNWNKNVYIEKCF